MPQSQLEQILTLASLSNKNPMPVEDVLSAFSMDMDALFDSLGVLSCCGAEFAGEGFFLAAVEDDKVVVDAPSFPKHFSLAFSAEEMWCFFLACEMLLSQKNHPLVEKAKALLEKIKNALGEEDRKKFEFFKSVMVLEESEVSYDDVLSVLRDAVKMRRAVSISYYAVSRAKKTKRIVHPYAVFYHGGWWYMPAHDKGARAVRLFRVDRVEKARMLDERFDVPGDFSLDVFQKDVLYFSSGIEKDVVVRFSKSAAPYVIEDWSARAKLTRQKDGSILAKIRCSNFEWLISELLSYGSDAEILSPSDARSAMLSVVSSMLKTL